MEYDINIYMDGIYVRISRIQYRLKKENVDTVRILQVENF